MPELVACPVCGCKVQAAEMILGRRTRCIACSSVFVAAPDLNLPPAAESTEASPHYPLRPEPAPPDPDLPPIVTRGRPRHRLPLCPGCHRPVAWEVPECPHCGQFLDAADMDRRGQWVRRRDGEPHRGRLIDGLGTFSMLGGALSLCTGPLGVAVALGTGVPALIMARHDLDQMRTGEVDPEGRSLTEFGRNKALVGVVLAILFGLFFFFVIVEMLHY